MQNELIAGGYTTISYLTLYNAHIHRHTCRYFKRRGRLSKKKSFLLETEKYASKRIFLGFFKQN